MHCSCSSNINTSDLRWRCAQDVIDAGWIRVNSGVTHVMHPAPLRFSCRTDVKSSPMKCNEGVTSCAARIDVYFGSSHMKCGWKGGWVGVGVSVHVNVHARKRENVFLIQKLLRVPVATSTNIRVYAYMWVYACIFIHTYTLIYTHVHI